MCDGVWEVGWGFLLETIIVAGEIVGKVAFIAFEVTVTVYCRGRFDMDESVFILSSGFSHLRESILSRPWFL